MFNTIDVSLFKRMVINGAINLKNNHEEVDRLNVFPVPDGDTGTNMSMTVTSGIRELEACESSSIIDNAKVLSRGALMGARGNSGVILSQFFRGLYVGIKDISHNHLDVTDLINCLDSGCKIAYKAVMEPVEGTILTVIREAIEAVKAKNDFNSIDEVIELYESAAKKSLDNTPNLLPVLKEAGVVDSGGAGFLKIVEGMKLALKGEILEATDGQKEKKAETEVKEEVAIKFLYSIDFVLELKKPDSFVEKELKAALSLLGDSLSVVREENKVKAHINTNRPGRALEISQKQGEFLTLKIDNRKHQVENNEIKKQEENSTPKKNMAVISVCFGEGIVQTFKDLGVDYVIEGGQTMNPSTESFVEAIKNVNAKNVIIIPNNSNVIMAAKQAASLVHDVNVEVIKAKTIAQGYASLVNYNPEAGLEENVEAMTEQIEHVTSGEITYSIRDTEIGGVKIKSGDYMGISNGEIIVSTEQRKDALKELLSKIISSDSEVITLFCGKDIEEDKFGEIEELCLAVNSDIDVEIIEGKQDIYSYIIAVE